MAKCLRPGAQGEELVEALKLANETLLEAIKVKRKNVESFRRLYAEFVEEWCRDGIDAYLVRTSLSKIRVLLTTFIDCVATLPDSLTEITSKNGT